ncbi:MAG: hypothetical protein OHK0040_09420 [bacterium]
MSVNNLNVSKVIDFLIKRDPFNEPILSNLLNCSVSKENFDILFPENECLKTIFARQQETISKELLHIGNLRLKYKFLPFNHPFLPHPPSSSKFNNYLLFVFADSYFLVKKPQFFKAFSDNSKPELADFGIKRNFDDTYTLFKFMIDLFVGVLERLKTEWSYLHPVFLFKDYESMFLHKILTENVFLEIEKSRGIKDVRRFVGNPSFTVISYRKTLEEWL